MEGLVVQHGQGNYPGRPGGNARDTGITDVETTTLESINDLKAFAYSSVKILSVSRANE